MRLSEKTREAIRPALFEAFFVLMGVLLALGANEWRQSVKDDEQVRLAKQTILKELTQNQQAVASSQQYHASLMQALTADHEEDWLPSLADTFHRGFVMPATLHQTAWNSAAQTGILAKMPYQDVLTLTSIYAHQVRYNEMAHSVSQIIYQALYDEGAQGIVKNYRNLSGIIQAFHYREIQLLQEYKKTSSALKEQKTAIAD